jgi:hypothetical protein
MEADIEKGDVEMRTVEVYFYGLICHIGPDAELGRTNAALVTTTDHLPKVVLSASNALTEIELLKGDVLSLSVGKGKAIANAAFDAYVPSLLEKTDKPSKQQALKNGVRKSSNFDVATAYFQHATSALVAADLYPHKASYSMPHKATVEQCVAEITLAVVQSNTDTVNLLRSNDLVSGRDDSWMIGDWVLVTNLFHTFSGIHLHQDHFKNHLALTDATEIAEVMKIKNGCLDEEKAFSEPNAVHLSEVRKYIYANSVPPLQANESKLVFFDLGQPDCSNTRWP